MSLSKNLGKIGGYILGEGVEALKGSVDSKLDEMKARVELAVQHATKKLALVFMALIGAVFILVGVAEYLSEKISGLGDGLGYVFVGAFVLFMALIGRLFSNN